MVGPKISIVSCLYKRPGLTRAWIGHTKTFGAIHVAVSEEEDRQLCLEHGIEHVVVPNRPLGNKHNEALRLARRSDADLYLLLPSDDFVNPEYLRRGIAAGADYVFPGSCGIVENGYGRACVLRKKGDSLTYGAGRIVSRAVVERVGDLWFPFRERGLDQNSHCTIRAHGFAETVVDVDEGVCLTDIKTEQNLWKYATVAQNGEPATVREVLAHVAVALEGYEADRRS